MATTRELAALLFFRGKREYKVAGIKFDLLLGEQHNFSNSVTEHNIEEGQPITDHIENQLERGGLTGLISNFSILTPGLLGGNRAQDAFDAMERLWKERTLVTISTIMKVYEDVAITNIAISRTEGTGEAIVANISFKKVNTVKLKKSVIEAGVSVGDMGPDLNKQAAPEVNAGKAL